jgi:hypothetical protein
VGGIPYEGAVYVCTNYAAGKCLSAEIKWIILGNQTVNKGTVHVPKGLTASIYTQKSDDPSGGLGGETLEQAY